MVDWAEAMRVAVSGIVSVFLVLVLLQISIQGASAVIAIFSRTQQQEKSNS